MVVMVVMVVMVMMVEMVEMVVHETMRYDTIVAGFRTSRQSLVSMCGVVANSTSCFDFLCR